MLKLQSYVYYGQTTSLCEQCLTLIQAKIIFDENEVYYLKHCLVHGIQKTLISSDIEYYKKCRDSVRLNQTPTTFNHKIEKGCPYDCGLCEDHEQHSCLAIIEIIDNCNLPCPTCIASSFPGAGNIKTLKQVEKMLDVIVSSEGSPDIVMISGGEPTIHPEIIDVLRLAKSKPINHLMLITNGVRIARDLAFVAELEKIKDGLEIYLQFDSLERDALIDIRGEDLRDTRRQAINNLEKAGISTTLVCVVKKGVNDTEVNKIIDYALQFRCIRGVTFQPVKATGRNNSFDKDAHRITLSEVRRKIVSDSNLFVEADMIPHPCNPENICIGYAIKKDGIPYAITEDLFLRFKNSRDLSTIMYFLPNLNTDVVKYENLFRVAIVSFLDKYDFCVSSVKRACIHFVTSNKEIIPLDTYYLFYASNTSGVPPLVTTTKRIPGTPY